MQALSKVGTKIRCSDPQVNVTYHPVILEMKWNFDMLKIAICFVWRACIKRTCSDHTRFSAFEIPELVNNSLWPSDAIWQYKDWSLLLKVMACRLTTQCPALPAPLLTYINTEL